MIRLIRLFVLGLAVGFCVFMLGAQPLHFVCGKSCSLQKHQNNRDAYPSQCDSNCVCGVNATCVISYGLYGNVPKYVRGAFYNVDLQKIIYPGWTIRVYHDSSVANNTILDLKALGVETISVSEIVGNLAGMFWRFLIADDPKVDLYIIRDLDSRLSWREKAAVDEWISSPFSFHSIRDHPNHARGLNGGLWGGRGRRLMFSMKQRVDEFFNKAAGYGHDLDFLDKAVWPQIANMTLSHDSYTCTSFPNSRPFPTQRHNWEIVGGVFSEDNVFRFSDVTCCTLNRPVDARCRRHPDWIYG